jgi:two-component system CheB/CheR fusion protein
MCIFARQNLAVDPPFSNLDLISCRNVLIYLGPTLQRKVLPVFHYALRPSGLLMLGASETVGSFVNLFSLMDKKAKVYTKRAVQTRPSVTFTAMPPAVPGEIEAASAPVLTAPAVSEIQKQADRIVLYNHSPAGVIINQQLEVLQFRGQTGHFLEHTHGEASLNLFRMAREGLLPDLRTAVNKAIKQGTRTRQEHVRIRQNGNHFEASIVVIPFSVPPTPEKFYLVLFEVRPGTIKEGGHKPRKSLSDPDQRSESAQVSYLQQELSTMRESMQSVIEEQEGTNEELRSANEEIMSSNEELQSTNEELETAKEELQSTNEELTTLNDELESRNSELQLVNNDLYNLLASVSIPVIILSSDLRIRRFTAAAEKMFKLIPGDIGRPLTDINVPLEIPDLAAHVIEVLESLAPKDLEVADKDGHWWSVRIRAYKTMDNKIDGVVIALVDIDIIKASAGQSRRFQALLEAIADAIPAPLMMLDGKLKITAANPPFFRLFGHERAGTVGRHIDELGGLWQAPKFRGLLENALQRQRAVDDYEVEHEVAMGIKKTLRFIIRPLPMDDMAMILVSVEEK